MRKLKHSDSEMIDIYFLCSDLLYIIFMEDLLLLIPSRFSSTICCINKANPAMFVHKTKK
jgi:hypothetical protein